MPKHEKVSDTLFLRIILSSVFGILICGISLAGLTWAWYSGSVTSTANNITAAEFSVTTTFKNNNGDTVNPTLTNGSYTLDSGDYTVTVSATGTASTGYCKVEFDGQTYYTVQLFTNAESGTQSATFTVNATANSKLTITPQWGTYAKSEDEVLIGNSEDDIDTLPVPSAQLLETASEESETYRLTDTEQTYTVQSGDTLEKIADRYGTTADVLCAYNAIQNGNEIEAGSTVKIPPAGYEIPSPTASQPTGEEAQNQTTDTSTDESETETISSEEAFSEESN